MLRVASPLFDFYVNSGSGSNTADGRTPDTAWQTLAKVTSSAALGPGARVGLARGGVWRETWNWPASTGTTARPVICGAYGAGPLPRITGANLVTGWSTTGTPSVWSAAVTTQPYTVAVDSHSLQKAASLAALTAGQWWWATNTLYLYSGTDPGTRTVEAGARENAVYLHESPLRPHVHFQDIRFDLTNDLAVRNNKNDDVGLRRCEFYGTAKVTRNGAYSTSIGSGGDLNGVTFDEINNDGVIGFNWYNPQIIDCSIRVVSGATSDCIQFDYGTEPTAATGWVVRGSTLTFDAPGSPKGCFISFGSDGLFEDNTCTGGNFGASMAANNITVRDCVFRDQGNLGALRIADNNSQPLSGHLYERVTIIRPHTGIMTDSPTGNPNRSNLTYNHLTIADATSRAVYMRNPVAGTIRNSVLWAPNRADALIDVESVVTGRTFTLDTCVLGPELPGIPLITWEGVAYNTLAAFAAAHPGVAVACQVVDPLFTDPATENYAPAPGSPLIGTATDAGNIGAV